MNNNGYIIYVYLIVTIFFFSLSFTPCLLMLLIFERFNSQSKEIVDALRHRPCVLV